MNLIILSANALLKIILKVFFSVLFMGHKENDCNVRKIIDLYQDKGFTSLFAKIRFWDSPFVQMEKLIPKKGDIWDLGCGDGLFTNYLALTGPKRKLIGIEVNMLRIKEAEKGFKNTKFFKGDALKAEITSPDVILMVHLLHHLNSYGEQENLLNNCVLKLKGNGKLIIAEIDKPPSFKYLFTLLSDVIIFPLLFEKKLINRVYYRDQRGWKNLLESLGLKVKIEKVYDKPFTHVIITAEK